MATSQGPSVIQGVHGGSTGKESTCNAGDPSFDSRVRKIHWRRDRLPPLRYSWAFLVAQLVKNLPAMQEVCVSSLGWEDPLKKETATHCSIHKELDTTESLSLSVRQHPVL